MTTLPGNYELMLFLDLIAICEGTCNAPHTTNHGYDVIVSGVSGPNLLTDYSKHPFEDGRAPIVVRNARPALYIPDQISPNSVAVTKIPAVQELLSTASGRYQIILSTWRHLATVRNLQSFSPMSQDLACLTLLDECGAPPLIMAGKIEQAIAAAANTWASFPGNIYGQNPKRMSVLLSMYKRLQNDPQAQA